MAPFHRLYQSNSPHLFDKILRALLASMSEYSRYQAHNLNMWFGAPLNKLQGLFVIDHCPHEARAYVQT